MVSEVGKRKVVFNKNDFLSLVLGVISISSVLAIDEVIFYDDINLQGEQTYLHLGSGCYNLDPEWNNRVSSVDLQGNCLEVFDMRDCKGPALELASWEQTAPLNLEIVKFNKLLTSLRVCGGGKRTRIVLSESRTRGTRQNIRRNAAVSQVALEEHNRYRSLHGSPPLREDVEMSALAQQHADNLAKNNKFEPYERTSYGENLATSLETNKLEAIRDVVKRWYDKIVYYSFREPEINMYRHKSEHFSSVVWKSTEKLGIGVSRNAAQRKWVVVVFYDPPATNSKYRENVSERLNA